MSSTANQPPEQLSRDTIGQKLAEADWFVQDKAKMNFNVGLGTTAREYPTGIGPTDYVLFVDPSAVSVVEAKPETRGEADNGKGTTCRICKRAIKMGFQHAGLDLRLREHWNDHPHPQ
jgi:type I site-specific restriction endonuclease